VISLSHFYYTPWRPPHSATAFFTTLIFRTFSQSCFPILSCTLFDSSQLPILSLFTSYSSYECVHPLWPSLPNLLSILNYTPLWVLLIFHSMIPAVPHTNIQRTTLITTLQKLPRYSCKLSAPSLFCPINPCNLQHSTQFPDLGTISLHTPIFLPFTCTPHFPQLPFLPFNPFIPKPSPLPCNSAAMPFF